MNKVKYSYMDHWEIQTPRGLMSPMVRKESLERFLKQLVVMGYEGLDTFAMKLPMYARLIGGEKGTAVDFEHYIQDLGLECMTSMFRDFIGYNPNEHVWEHRCHDRILEKYRQDCEYAKGTGIKTFVVMPSSQYFWCMDEKGEITDDVIHAHADLWNRVGKMMMEDYGIYLSCHHEFWSGLRDLEVIKKFYAWTDPKYVYYFCDTAQHVIAGVDPVDVYDMLADRTRCFHLKDTRNTDPGSYKIPPDAECLAKDVNRWFYEAGSGKGLCDFPKLFEAMKRHNYCGWISSEHDKAEMEGKSFSDCTGVSMWYVKNVLDPILDKEEK
ncbi:MAG: sugar phosphate isomerase/epimerase [Oscillospiraceae bacterium]|nr:sugar phosphate isomerase/epimerase [Oscillospiraceae bacterium]